jgi:hypothetical protein
MKKPISHVIDEQAVEMFRAALPKDAWTIYDIKPDYGKDQKVELVEGGDHTGLSFWVQVKGQKKVRRLRDGTVTFKLETKDLDYHTRLPAPMFLVVVDVTKKVGYWIFTQRYERTALRNVNWRDQEYIQIRLPPANILTDLSGLRKAVKDAIRFMTGLAFGADIHSEKRALEDRDPRFQVEISVDTKGRHYHFRTDEVIPVEFSYKEGDPGSGKIEAMLDRGHPVTFTPGEIEIKGSPLFGWFLEMAGRRDVQFECNRHQEGHINVMRTDASGAVLGRIDAIPCKITCGRKEASVEGNLPPDLLAVRFTVSLTKGETRQASMPISLSAWTGHPLLNLPHFESLASVFGGHCPGERFFLECYIPGQRVLSAPLDFADEKPYSGICVLFDVLRKARAIAALKGVNPTLPEDFGCRRILGEIEELYEVLIGEGRRTRAPQARVTMTITRGGLRKFLADVDDPSVPGTLNLWGDGSFPFLAESVVIDPLEHVVTEARPSSTSSDLRNQLNRHPPRKSFRLVWEATQATELILRARRDSEAGLVKTG